MRNLFLGGGRSQLFRAILSTAAFKKVARDPEVDKNREKYLDFVYRCPPKRGRAIIEVDKNGAKSLDFVYHCPQK